MTSAPEITSMCCSARVNLVSVVMEMLFECFMRMRIALRGAEMELRGALRCKHEDVNLTCVC